jgi:hypothetical protein
MAQLADQADFAEQLHIVAFAVDTGLIALTQTRLQNGADAASLAASIELSVEINQGGKSVSVANARQMAVDVAAANGVYINPDTDVVFGNRRFDAATNTWLFNWNAEPYNAIQLTARRDNPDVAEQDGELQLSFGWAVGKQSVPLTTTATAIVQARDIVLVLDFSASMNDDSSIKSFDTMGQSNVEDSLDAMWDALVAADPKWPGTSESKFPANGFGDLDSYYGMYISSNSNSTIFQILDFDEATNGVPDYPYPQAGRYTSGTNKGLPMNKPNYGTSQNLWKDYIRYVKNLDGPYRKRYGYRTLMDYMQERRFKSIFSEDLWRTPHYPFHAVKQGASKFLDYLTELDFGDEVGLVSYGGYSKIELELHDGDANVSITDDPITDTFSYIDTMQRHKQAGHYHGSTGMGFGIKDARELLNDHARYGAHRTMILMTDGMNNRSPSGWSLPSGWDWGEWTDLDGDGSGDYSTENRHKAHAFWEAINSVNADITIHTISVGQGADRALMETIAFAGGGVWVDVPGGSTVAEMEEQLNEAFRKIAAAIPPTKLVYVE